MQPKKFALIGAAGFVAPRHLEAIRDVGGVVVAALDPHDNVGILDRYGFETEFFTEEYRFERHLRKLRSDGNGVDYVSVCSPNYLHDRHTHLGLRVGAAVICEKPLVINPDNLHELHKAELETDRRVHPILQLRLHPDVAPLREQLRLSQQTRRSLVEIDYYTPRGRWYAQSWKANEARSGGLLMNIGVHLFDLVQYLVGGDVSTATRTWTKPGYEVSGSLVRTAADVDWRLGIWPSPDRPTPVRRFVVNGQTLDLSMTQALHTESYRRILAGNGWRIEDARPAIELVNRLRA